MKELKVIHLPTSTGGNSFGLSEGEKKNGLFSRCLVKEFSWLRYPADINLRISKKKTKIGKLLYLIYWFFKIRSKFDVFHFNFGTSLIDFNYPFLKLFDLRFYPENAIKVMTYNGCDVRQKYPTILRRDHSACHYDKCYNGMCNSGELDKLRRGKASVVTRNVDHIFYLNPDLSHFLPSYKSSFLPYTIAEWDNIETLPYRKKCSNFLRVVHAPTNRVTKGSSFIEKAVEEINKDGKRIELVLVEGIQHEEALEIYKSADLVIDQLLIGWYGAFAVEVMKMGIPLVTYFYEEDLTILPKGMKDDLIHSIINAGPDNLKDKLIECLDDSSLLEKYHYRVVKYVEKWHDPIKVAEITEKVYRNLRTDKLS